MAQTTLPVPTPQALDPFGLPINPADLACWPPSDPAELARLDEWADRMEREHAERGDE